MSTSLKLHACTILLTGGRAPATLELARLFHRAGHRVVIAESQRHYLSRVSTHVDGSYLVAKPNAEPDKFVSDLLQIIEREHVDLLIPTCEEVFFVARGRERLAAKCRVLVDSLETLGLLHNKWTFNQYVAQLGLTAPQSHLVVTRTELEALCANARRPVVAKPAYSRFASNALILKPGDVLPEVQISAQNPYVVQEFIAGTEICSYSIFENGVLLAHSDYVHAFKAGKGAGICFESLHDAEIKQWVERLGQSLGFTGQMAFDFIRTADGKLYPLECNPRATSGAHLFTFEDRLDQALLGTHPLAPIEPSANRFAMVGLAMVLFGLPSVRSVAQLKNWLQVMRRARETTFTLSDPWPFFYQFVALGAMALTSIRLGIGILEASTVDIEWNGPA